MATEMLLVPVTRPKRRGQFLVEISAGCARCSFMRAKRIVIANAYSEALEILGQALSIKCEVRPVRSAAAALGSIKERPCDVLVADLDFPEPDTLDIINRIRREHSKTIFFFSGSDEARERLMNPLLGTYQLIPKSCDADVLENLIERALALDPWIANKKLRDLVSRVRAFPTVPSVYLEVSKVLQSLGITPERVGEIISRDTAVISRLLHALNSATFELPGKVTEPAEAVGILGFEASSYMVMTIQVLSQYDKVKPLHLSVDELWKHSINVAQTARQIVMLETQDQAMAEVAFSAGLMHDLGKVVLAANFDEQYRGAQSLARKQDLPLSEVEREFFGASHGEIGAFLLGLWGMPLELLEVAALHHRPSSYIVKSFSPITAVHVANALENEFETSSETMVVTRVDENYLSDAGVLDRLQAWRQMVAARKLAQPQESETAKQGARETAKTVALVKPRKGRVAPPNLHAPASFSTSFKFPRGKWLYAGVASAVALVLLTGLILKGSSKTSKKPMVVRATSEFRKLSVAKPDPVSLPSPEPPANTNVSPHTEVTVPPQDISEVVEAPKPTVAKPAPQTVFTLQGIFFSANHPTALINGQTVKRHDRIAGATVLEIERSSVTLQQGTNRTVLLLE